MDGKILLIAVLIFLSSISCVSAIDFDDVTSDSGLNQLDSQNLAISVGSDDISSQNQDGMLAMDSQSDDGILEANIEDENNTISAKSSENSDVSSSPSVSSGNKDSSAYLVLDNDADKENVHIGDYVTWIITVANLGPGTAKNVKVFDQLPDGLKYIKHEASKGTFDPKTGIWDIGDISLGDYEFLFITTVALTLGEKVNKAILTSDTLNLNNETYEEEEIDVEEEDSNDKDKDTIDYSLKAAGNPILLVLISLFGCLIVNFKRK
ncbi:DUF11 domain-containing protein [uncultured Methanobrevibacter sp.]|uniref:DUF11 domain-containing protein n=1 Tax=uncultured Methanobrevibacter sp. TaxID=253161 RepID=UPI00260837A2|nr:DUF11 domain-containing protein [uncultured Methanobrevibacter sp.]